jgi:hypothetical protein
MRRVRLVVVSAMVGVGSLLPQLAGAPAKAHTCQANVPGGEVVCAAVLAVEGAVCRAVNKPCLM